MLLVTREIHVLEFGRIKANLCAWVGKSLKVHVRPLKTESTSSSPRIPVVLCSHVLHTLLHPSCQGINRIFHLGFSPLTNYVLPSQYTHGNERVDLTLKINSHKSCSSSLSVWILSFKIIKNTKFLKSRAEISINPGNFHTL